MGYSVCFFPAKNRFEGRFDAELCCCRDRVIKDAVEKNCVCFESFYLDDHDHDHVQNSGKIVSDQNE